MPLDIIAMMTTAIMMMMIIIIILSSSEAYIDGLVQDCSNSIANAMELLQSCTKLSICWVKISWSNG